MSTSVIAASSTQDLLAGLIVLDADLPAMGERELALGAFDLNGRVRQRDFHVGRHDDRLTSDTGHVEGVLLAWGAQTAAPARSAL